MSIAETQTVTPEAVDALMAEILNEAAAEEEAAKTAKDQLVALSTQVRNDFTAAHQHRLTIGLNDRFDKCMRLYMGEYDAAQLAKIRTVGGSEVYFNLIAQKCESAAAWIEDQINIESYEPPIEPTPISELPADDMAKIDAEVAGFVQESIAAGAPLDPAALVFAKDKITEFRRGEIQKEAQDKADGMKEKILDQMIEGGFEKAFARFILHLKIFPIAYLKATVESRVQSKWNGAELVEVPVDLPAVAAPNPRDVYFAPNAATMQDGPVCETFNIKRSDLAAMKGKPGWIDEEIDAVLSEAGAPANERAYLPDEPTRQDQEKRESTINEGIPEGMMCGVEYWGAAREGTPFEKDTELKVIILGGHTVYADPNPNPKNIHPYFATTPKKVPGAIVGIAIPEKGEPVQLAANACARNLIDNLALSSRSQASVDIDAVDGMNNATKITPGKIWLYHGSKLRNQTRQPIEFFTPPNNAGMLIEAYNFFANMMDDLLLIPRFMQGNGELTGAGTTSSGLSMLMSAAGKGIRSIIANIHTDIFVPFTDLRYNWNLKYLPNAEWAHIKGDCQIRGSGPLVLMSKELTDMRVSEAMDKTNNPIDMAIIKLKGRAKLLQHYFTRLKLPDVAPTDEEIQAGIETQTAASLVPGAGAPSGPMQGQMPGEMMQQPTQPIPSGDLAPEQANVA